MEQIAARGPSGGAQLGALGAQRAANEVSARLTQHHKQSHTMELAKADGARATNDEESVSTAGAHFGKALDSKGALVKRAQAPSMT